MNKKYKNIPKSVVASCFLAGCLEIYDFTIFVFLTPIITNKYLTFMDTQTAQIISYALFAVGFLFRPLGAIIFGYIGDKYGRKKSLIISVSLMGTASLVMFLLPTYEMIGITSCYIIALVRIIQGFSVGGEYSGAIIFAVEHTDNKHAGLAGSIVVSGCMSGVLLSTIVSHVINNHYLPDGSWRIAFLLGSCLSLIGYFIRKKITETPEFNKVYSRKNKMPILDGFTLYTKESIATILIAAINGINLYTITVYLPGYLGTILKTNVSYLAIITTSVMAICIPIFGYLSDKIGRERQLFWGILVLSIFTNIMLSSISSITTISLVVLFIILHGIIASIQSGAMNTCIVEIFPVSCRFSCSGISYSIGMGIIGGSTPMLAAFMHNKFGLGIDFLNIYVSTISFSGLLALWLVIKKRKKNLAYEKNTFIVN